MKIFKLGLFLLVIATSNAECITRAKDKLLRCDYNTVMCCWDENRDEQAFNDNTDVCTGSRKRPRLKQYPGDSEGDVHCHGIVWPDKADLSNYIMPLFRYVRSFDHQDDRGYYSNVKGSPKCDC
ncbi:unnamed protein product, partial [Discosporangium mesarthrocarpum]